MELYTKNHDPSWDRIVHICVHDDQKVSKYINEKELYKIVVLSEGTLTLKENNVKRLVSAPALMLVTDNELAVANSKNMKATTVYFKPTEVREEFTIDRIKSGEFENEMGRTIYQDYLLVQSFAVDGNKSCKVIPLSLSAHAKIIKTIELMNVELQTQHDGYWPCRSRSYMMELLYFISYVCSAVDEATTNKSTRHMDVNNSVSDDTVSEIMQYLSEHIGEKITLEDVMKEFSLNRNKLNELFIKETSMTCLNYLTRMRVNLAQIMLAETEIHISEIADRVGFEDPNYFVKVFKKHTGVTPSKYRSSFN